MIKITAIAVKHTARTDGNGKPQKGYYITRFGYPLGQPYKTVIEAKKAAALYIKELISNLHI